MMKKFYIRFNKLDCNKYTGIQSIIGVDEIKTSYKKYKEFAKRVGDEKVETFIGYKLSFILLEINFDGRKTQPCEDDIFKSLAEDGLAKKVEIESFLDFYLPTKKLIDIERCQLRERKKLVDKGIFKYL